MTPVPDSIDQNSPDTTAPVWARWWTALRSYTPSKAVILRTSAGLGASILALAGVGIATSYTTVLVEVDGVSRPYSSFSPSVGSVLADLDIEVASYDHVAPGVNTPLPDGSRIVVRHARSVELTIDGVPTTIKTTASSMEDVLTALESRGEVHASAHRSALRENTLPLVTRTQQVPVKIGDTTRTVTIRPGDDIRTVLHAHGVTISPLDRVKVRTSGGSLAIDIQTVTRGYVTETEEIPFTERLSDSAELFKGETTISQKGVNGVVTLRKWKETVDGVVVNEHLKSRTVTTAPVEQIRAQGTKEASPIELVKAGIDPKATLEDGYEPDGTPSKRYRAALGTLSSDSEIAELRAEAQLHDIPLVYSGEDPRAIARPMVAARGWNDAEFRCLVALWERESHWNPYAENPYSGAYGIPQSLPGSKMASVGPDWRTNPVTQITWGLNYIGGRYGTPCNAWGHSEAVGWY